MPVKIANPSALLKRHEAAVAAEQLFAGRVEELRRALDTAVSQHDYNTASRIQADLKQAEADWSAAAATAAELHAQVDAIGAAELRATQLAEAAERRTVLQAEAQAAIVEAREIWQQVQPAVQAAHDILRSAVAAERRAARAMYDDHELAVLLGQATAGGTVTEPRAIRSRLSPVGLLRDLYYWEPEAQADQPPTGA